MVQKELSGRALVWILSAAEEDYLPLPRLSMTPVRNFRGSLVLISGKNQINIRYLLGSLVIKSKINFI